MKKNTYFFAIIFSFFLALLSQYLTDNQIIHFITSSLAVVFLASLLGKATEGVAFYAGQRLGGFLNATFGNATELIIAVFLVKEGMFDVVKASITGSIIGNMLLVLGLSALLGGIKYKNQHYNEMLATQNASLMLLAIIALFIPAMYTKELNSSETEVISLIVSFALIIVYILWLIFSMITHKKELSETLEEEIDTPLWSKNISILLLIIATILTAFVSEWLVHSVETVAHLFGWSDLFIGTFLIAIIGNAAEHSAAVILAMKNRIGGAVEIAIGSSLQISLFVAPLLVFISLFFGKPMDIIFTTYELIAIAVAVFITKSISRDGRTNWYEGLLLLTVYLMIGTVFYFI